MFRFVRLAGAILVVSVFALSLGFFSGSAASAAEPDRSTRVYFPKQIETKAKKGKKKDRFVSRKGVFRVKLVGYQINRWSVHSPPDGICSGELTGGGFERVVFRQPARRMKLSAFGMRRLTSMIFPRLFVRGQLTRQGSYDYTPLENPSPDCPYGDGGGDIEPTPPDCGTRKFARIPMSIFALDGFFQLRSEGNYTQRPRFRNCPSPRVQWPEVITERTNGKPIQTRFPGKLIFNPKFDRKTGRWSKVIVIAKGVKKLRTFTSASTTRLQWTLTLKRLR